MATRRTPTHHSSPDDDPMPQPPIEPALEDCCGSGCDPCIFDIHEQARVRYEDALRQWKARHGQD